MGWDCYAVPEPKEDALAAWKKAALRVQAEAGSVDGDLSRGGLNVSTCGMMLENATRQGVYDPDDWTPEKVQRLATEADWDFEVNTRDKWAYLSALEFLNTCSREGLGVRFSY